MKKLELQERVKGLRIKKGFSQEELADNAGLSLRTVQRIENGESVPRGDTLKRLSIALQVTPDDLIDWRIQTDKNVLKLLSFSPLAFLVFPLLGIIIPLAIWILKKDTIKYVNPIGKSVLNFQLTWAITIFGFYILFIMNFIFHLGISMFFILFLAGGLYIYNLIIIIGNIILVHKSNEVKYIPAVRFLS